VKPRLKLSDDHVYTLGKRVIPGVTQIIGEAGLSGLDGIPPWQLEQAALRGTHVHTACELLDAGTLDWGTVSPEIEGYVHGWRALKDAMRPTILESEQIGMNPGELFAGKPDRVVKIRGVRGVVDIKSGASCASHWLQIEAYKRIVGVQVGWIVYVRKDGTYTLAGPVRDARAWYTFQAALTVYQWKHKGE